MDQPVFFKILVLAGSNQNIRRDCFTCVWQRLPNLGRCIRLIQASTFFWRETHWAEAGVAIDGFLSAEQISFESNGPHFSGLLSLVPTGGKEEGSFVHEVLHLMY